MWSDNETNSDFIDFQHLIGATISIIENENLLPSSIGIFGDWGSGKSSLMKMIEANYAKDSNILVISFNGWLFEGYEDTKTVLMSRIVDEIIRKRTLGEKALKLAAKLLKKIDLLKVGSSAVKHGLGFLAMGPAGLAITSSSEMLGELGKIDYEKFITDNKNSSDPDQVLRTNIQEFHQNFEDLIKETKIEKIIVTIDDLDRCSYDTVIGTLEAIKLFLFAKKTAFIIGADERLIKYAVRRRFPEIPGDSIEVGRDYLEKLIQYPIRIPPLSELELTIYVNLLFASLYCDPGEFEFVRAAVIKKKNESQFDFRLSLDNIGEFVKKVEESLKEDLILSAQIIPVLAVGLNGNPRQTKRFLNTMLLRRHMAEFKGQNLDKRVLAKLMLLEYFKPETFKTYYRLQAENDGIIPEMDLMEKIAGSEEVKSSSVEKLSIEQQGYLEDSWILRWLVSEPSFTKTNFQPYFYFSRDKLSASGITLQRMSSQGQEVFRKLMENTAIIRNSGLKEAADLSPGDASAIFESFLERIKYEGKQTGDEPLLKRLFDFCEVRKELISQLLGWLEKLPHQLLPLGSISWITAVSDGTTHNQTTSKILLEWSKSTSNKNLAKLAKRKLKE